MSSLSHKRSSVEKATVGVCPSPYDETVYLQGLPVLRQDEEDEERGGDHRDADDDDNADDADDAYDTVLLSHPLLGEAL